VHRYQTYKIPFDDNLLDPDIDIKSLRQVDNTEFKTRYIINGNRESRLSSLDAHKILNADFLEFVHNNLPFQISWVEIFPLPANNESVIVQETSREDDYSHEGLFYLSKGCTWNIHNSERYRRHMIGQELGWVPPEGYPNFYAFTLPGQKGTKDFWLSTSKMPIVESYTDCAFIGKADIPHSVITDNTENAVFAIFTFEIDGKNKHERYRQVSDGFSPWAVKS